MRASSSALYRLHSQFSTLQIAFSVIKMLDWSKRKSSFDDQTELPLYNNHYTRHASLSHSTGLTSRSVSHSPTGSFSNLPPMYADSRPVSPEKNYSFLHQSKKPLGDETTELAEASPSNWKIAAVVIFYLVAAIVMVFANKWVLRATAIPIIFLLCQLSLATALLQAAGFFGFLEIPKLDLKIGKQLLPLISINVIGLVFNTFCLQHVDASFYQIARGLVLPFTVLALPFSWLSAQSQHYVDCLSRLRGIPLGGPIGPSTHVPPRHRAWSSKQHDDFSSCHCRQTFIVRHKFSYRPGVLQQPCLGRLFATIDTLHFWNFCFPRSLIRRRRESPNFSIGRPRDWIFRLPNLTGWLPFN